MPKHRQESEANLIPDKRGNQGTENWKRLSALLREFILGKAVHEFSWDFKAVKVNWSEFR